MKRKILKGKKGRKRASQKNSVKVLSIAPDGMSAVVQGAPLSSIGMGNAVVQDLEGNVFGKVTGLTCYPDGKFVLTIDTSALDLRAEICRIFDVSPILLRGRPLSDEKEEFVRNQVLPLAKAIGERLDREIKRKRDVN